MSDLPASDDARKRAIESAAGYLRDFLEEPLAFRGQQLRGGGPVAAFEGLLAERYGFPYCVATCNATAALMGLVLSLRLRDRPVWFPRDHWEGSVSAMRAMGARIRRYVPANGMTSSMRSGAIVVPESLPQTAGELAGRCRDCVWIEDSSRSPRMGGTDDPGLSRADILVVSFGPGKPLSLGEGGAVLFRSRHHHQAFLKHCCHPERWRPIARRAPGVHRSVNSRIHPLAAIVGTALLSASNACLLPMLAVPSDISISSESWLG